jgi:chromosome segregation ATPase
MLAGKARELDAAAERIGKQLEELNAAEAQRATAIQQMEGEQDRLTQRIYELDAEIRQKQNVLNQTALEVDRSENRIAFNRQRAQELAGRQAQMDAELKRARAQAAEWETRSATQVQAVTLLRGESGVLNARVEELLQRVEERGTQIRDGEGRIEALRQRASEAGESLLRLHGEQKQAEEALAHQSEALRKAASEN